MLADRRSFNLATNFAGQWLRLRNIDAVNPKRRSLSGLRRQPAASLPAGDRALLRQRAARGSQRAHVHQGGLHVPQRTPGEALRNSQRLRKPVPPRDARARKPARRPAAAGQRAVGHVVCDPDIAGASRSTGAAATSSARRRRRRRRTCRRSTRATWPPIFRCASAWLRIAATPCARAVIARSIRWASRSRTSMRWDSGETLEVDGQPVDASGALPGAAEFRGIDGLEDALLRRPELFAATLTENLLTFALGRGVEYYDAPAVRKIVSDAREGRIPVLVAHSRNREERSVSNAAR